METVQIYIPISLLHTFNIAVIINLANLFALECVYDRGLSNVWVTSKANTDLPFVTPQFLYLPKRIHRQRPYLSAHRNFSTFPSISSN